MGVPTVGRMYDNDTLTVQGTYFKIEHFNVCLVPPTFIGDGVNQNEASEPTRSENRKCSHNAFSYE